MTALFWMSHDQLENLGEISCIKTHGSFFLIKSKFKLTMLFAPKEMNKLIGYSPIHETETK
jgi:hypothetical protein